MAAPKAVIVALHGMSDYSNAFDMPAKAWAKRGITTLAIDQRGFGRAPDPGLWAGGEAMRHDLDDFVLAARARFPGVKIFAAGESMGGAVLLSALASPQPPAIDGAILVSPAVWSRADMPALYRVALFMVAHIMPGIILTNSAAGKVVKVIPSDNIPMLIALGKDPLFQKKTRADTLYGLVNLMGDARAAPSRLAAAAADPLSAWRQGPGHSGRARRSHHPCPGCARRCARISGRLSYAAARPGRRQGAERCRKLGSAAEAGILKKRSAAPVVVTPETLSTE